MKQHLAKSLLMAGAMVASYPLLAQQAQPIQQSQPMPSMQPMQSAQPAPAGEPTQAMPSAASSAQKTMPAARDPYAQAAGQPTQQTQPGMAPAPVDPTLARGVDPAMDPANTTLAPDALGTRLGQRNPFLDGA